MKNLRQLVRQSGLLSSGKRRRRNEKSRPGSRPLGSETLEKRELLAGDALAPQHNYWNSYDVNDDGQITARDALAIVNKMSRLGSEGEALTSSSVDADAPEMFYDVNADSRVTASDALSVINAISRGEEVGELVELQLRALSDPADIESEISSVGVGETFHLEVSYDDLRLFNDRLGVFQLFTDIAVSQPNLLVPVLNETQRIVIGEEFTQSPFPSSITFGREGSSQTVESQFADFAGDSRGEIIRVLTEFGLSESQFDVGTLQFDNNDLGFEISYLGTEFGNVDVPDLTIEVNENGGVDVPTQFIEFAPFEADGTTPNSDAVRFNINAFSRTFNANEEFYSRQNRGAFSLTDGFTGVGGLGQIPGEGGGIPQLTDDGGFLEPFDAFSIPVQIVSPVSNLQISVNPGEDPEATLLYGRDDAVPQDLVLIGENAVVTISAGDVVGGIDATNGTLDVVEDMPNTLDLATLITGGPADMIMIQSDPTLGTATLDGSVLTYTPTADANGADTLTYTVTGGGATDTATISINISAVNDAPVATPDFFTTAVDAPLTITVADLLGNDTDVDNAAADLSVTAVTASGQNASTATLDGTNITFLPGSGFSGTDTFTYTLSDGTATSTGTATVTVGDVVAVPVLSPGSLTVNEDGTMTLDLSTLVTGGGAATSFSAEDGDFGTATVDGNILTYTPDPDEFGDDAVVFTAINSGGSASETIDITITAVNDLPTAGPDSFNTLTDQPLEISVDSLLDNDTVGADNEDDDILDVTAVNTSTAGATVTLSGSTITYTPASGFDGTDTFTYTLTDGTDTTTGTVTVSVTATAPVNTPPSSGPLSVSATEDTPVTFTSAAILANATPGAGETGQTVSVASIGAGSAGGTATLRSDGGVRYTPAANFNGAETFTVTITDDFSPAATGTFVLTVNVAAVNDAPTAANDSATAFTGTTTNINVLGNDSAGPADENQDLTVVLANSSGGAVAINSNGTLAFTPNAGFTGATTINYTIRDSGGLEDSGVVNVTVQDFIPTTISGSIFIDNIAGPSETRNGIQDPNDAGIGGIPVRLVNSSGATVAAARTNLDGGYSFINVAPGSYTVIYDLPDTATPIGSTSSALVVNPDGSQSSPTQTSNLTLSGTTGTGLSTLNILSSSYLRSSREVAGMSNGGREGGVVAFGDDGVQSMFIAGEGFDDVVFGELLINSRRDTALLVIVREGATSPEVATIGEDNFVLSADGSGAQFFGGTDDFDFASTDAPFSTEFAGYQAAVDRALSEL